MRNPDTCVLLCVLITAVVSGLTKKSLTPLAPAQLAFTHGSGTSPKHLLCGTNPSQIPPWICFQNGVGQNIGRLSLAMLYFINIWMGSSFQYHYHGVAPLPGYNFIISVPSASFQQMLYTYTADLAFVIVRIKTCSGPSSLFSRAPSASMLFLPLRSFICFLLLPLTNTDHFSSSDTKHFSCGQYCLFSWSSPCNRVDRHKIKYRKHH